ncbi:hypothetical protein L6452_42545 [Arctium lappa]|uniref:Uncharacterized protein n=1 Tax=Arctium lappa TaxID=4217 RepID=A0ACB8XIS4_ARCLA|nr:hypothetical protein L6452_42545 [Arctium lappa]
MVDLKVGQSEAGEKMKTRLYFTTWWCLNVVYSYYNKKVLNAFPFPWLASTLSLGAGTMGEEQDPQRLKKIATAGYDKDNDYWSNVLIPPQIASRSDVTSFVPLLSLNHFISYFTLTFPAFWLLVIV